MQTNIVSFQLQSIEEKVLKRVDEPDRAPHRRMQNMAESFSKRVDEYLENVHKFSALTLLSEEILRK